MKRGWQWPVLVTAALAFTVGVNVVMFVAANADPNGTVVEPDYYRKAVEWDRTMARRAASDLLGWSARVSLAPAAGGRRHVTVSVRDSSGAAVTGAEVHVTLIHNREASQPVQATLALGADGAYFGDVGVPRQGLWEVRVDARRGEERFVATVHTEAP